MNENKTRSRNKSTLRRRWGAWSAMGVAVALLGGGAVWWGGTQPAVASGTSPQMKAEVARYIGYYHTIRLNPEQEKIKTAALEQIPAPCCASFSMATCCCPCNLAKSVWGLSNHLIAEKGYGVDQVKKAALDWIAKLGPSGFGGDACFVGHCNTPFHKDGCGGMSESTVF